MSLNHLQFIIIFSGVLLLISIMQLFRSKVKILKQLQLGVLFIFSLYFIYTWDWRYCVLALYYAFFVYTIGLLLKKSIYKKVVLTVGIVASLIVLGYFKYANFFIGSFANLFGMEVRTLDIILPLGISFYTFAGISYMVDVYRGSCQADHNIFHLCLYMLFFGKMISGPIVKAREFLPQVKAYRGVQLQEFLAGIQIFVFGLFKKIVLADHLCVFVDDVFYSPNAYNTVTVILGIISYSLQIYFDFSGYSDMAIGVSKMVGFNFKANFNLPYISNNISDFWKRWHISLSSWFQEYLYIPLGGSQKGDKRTYLNFMIVMLVSGLWHGAGYTFVFWGTLHGLVCCINRFLKKKVFSVPNWICILMNYLIVTLIWVPFRAGSMENTLAVWRSAFTFHNGIFQPYTWSFFAIGCLIVSTIMAKARSSKRGEDYVNGYYPILDLSRFWNLVILFVLIGLIVLMGYFGDTAFIYGRF